MTGRPLSLLRDRHQGEDIWIIAAGPSAGFVDPAFFEGKTTIGVNRVWRRFETTYVVLKESSYLQAAIDDGQKVIVSRHNTGALSFPESQADGYYYVFDHLDNQLTEVDLSVIGTDKIVVSYSTITSAMHVAAYLGAANIIMVGHDCGTIDGKLTIDDYGKPLISTPGFYEKFLSQIEPQSVAVREKLREVYGCRLYSLNPWLNFGLESHEYKPA